MNRRSFRLVVRHCVLILMILPAAAMQPGDGAGERIVLARADRLESAGPGEITLDLDERGYRHLHRAGRAMVRDFPLPDRVAVDLDLRSFNLLAPRARLVVVDEQGEHERPVSGMRFFRGTVEGDPDSLVSLSLFDGRLAGFVRTRDEEFVVGPDSYNLARPGAQRLRVRNVKAEGPGAATCDGHVEATSKATALSRSRGTASSRSIDESTLLEAAIAIDATYEWYSHFGTVNAAQDYLLNLMAQISTIYETEINVKILVPYVRIFTTSADPYTDGSTDTAVLLSDLRSEWNANQLGVSRAAAHLFSVRPSGGSGRAYLDVLCSNDNQPGSSWDYGVSTLSAVGQSWEKRLVAHEIGHNFSSPHTHCYTPEIDRCYNAEPGCFSGTEEQVDGTIMSYCDVRLAVFDPRVKDERIRPAAEAAFPTCVDTAGLPGRIDGGQALVVDRPARCAPESLVQDDGSVNQYYGYSGTTQMAWIKRFTPACYPFRLDRVQVVIGHSSVFVGRPIRVLVYTDPGGSGDPANAILAYSEDATVQVVSASLPNEYILPNPVLVSSGDYYIGFYDLEADATSTYIGTVDFSTEGDSWRAPNSTGPGDFTPHPGGTWMVRGSGGPIGPAGIVLQWDAPCNGATTPEQDYAVYRGDIGDYSSHAGLTCSTGRATTYLTDGAADDSYFLVVPATSAAEGSYGLDGTGVERVPAVLACKPQSAGACP